jgi:hypothetical protein
LKNIILHNSIKTTMMNSKIFFAAFALMMGLTIFAHAQSRGGHHRHNGGGQYNNHNGYYNNGGHGNNSGYYNNGDNCNDNNDVYYNGNGYRGDRCGNGYRNRRIYRRPVNYCQQVPVVVYQQAPVYCPPPRVILGRPRVHINIGF